MITWRRFLLDTCVLAALAMVLVVIGVFAAPAIAMAIAGHFAPPGAQLVFTSARELHFWSFVAAFALPPLAAWFVDLIDHLRGRDAPSPRRLALVGLAVVVASAALIALSVHSAMSVGYGDFTPMISMSELVDPSLAVWATIVVVVIAAFLFGGAVRSPRPSAAPARGSAGSGAADSPASRD